jgi:uroporphyrinogen III methyltransferase/synthase
LIPVLGEVKGQRILLPRAAEAREILPQELQTAGAQVDVIAVYNTIQPQTQTQELRELLQTAQVDLITFTSSSTVHNFMAVFPDDNIPAMLRNAAIGCIGPITADTAREYGLTVRVQPEQYTIPAFTQAIMEYFRA